MKSFNMEVSKKENGAYVKQGVVTVWYALLSEYGIAIEPKEFDSEGFPVYEDAKVQYVFDATLAGVKSQARNRLVSGTATLKPGLKIAETVEELLESGGGNKGEALAIIREMLVAFKAFLATTGKSAKVQDAILNLASSRKSIALITAEQKQKFAGYLAQFAETLTEEQAVRFANPLIALNEATEEGEALDDM